MSRDYFKRSAAGSPSPSGTVITDIQSSLNALSAFDISVDGVFGAQTQDALTGFQTARGLPVTGTVSDTTWTALMHSDEPPIFERCLQIVASFEGTGFTLIEGNFDGAGLTWGIIGFTLSNGELTDNLLQEISIRFPELLTQAFGHEATTLMQSIGPTSNSAQRMAFANSISAPAPQFRVAGTLALGLREPRCAARNTTNPDRACSGEVLDDDRASGRGRSWLDGGTRLTFAVRRSGAKWRDAVERTPAIGQELNCRLDDFWLIGVVWSHRSLLTASTANSRTMCWPEKAPSPTVAALSTAQITT